MTHGLYQSDWFAGSCDAFEAPLDFDFQTDAGPMAPILLPEVTATEEPQIDEDDGLDALVCCDGAEPYLESFDCELVQHVAWSTGFCTHTQGTGRLHVTFDGAEDLPLPTAQMVYYQLFVDASAYRGPAATRRTAGRRRTAPARGPVEPRAGVRDPTPAGRTSSTPAAGARRTRATRSRCWPRLGCCHADDGAVIEVARRIAGDNTPTHVRPTVAPKRRRPVEITSHMA